MGYDPADPSVLLFESTAGAQLRWDRGLLSPSLTPDQEATDLGAAQGQIQQPGDSTASGSGDLRPDMQRAAQAPAPACGAMTQLEAPHRPSVSGLNLTLRARKSA